MVMCCVAFGCRSKAKKGQDLSFHGFPVDPDLKSQWIRACRGDGNLEPSKHARLCSQHFETNDFVYEAGKRCIKTNVIPSVFNFSSEGLRKDRKKRSPKMKEQNTIQPTVTRLILPNNVDAVRQNKEVQNRVNMVFVSEPNVNSNLNNVYLSSRNVKVCECATVIPQPQPKTQPVTNKRKRQVPAYMGDISDEDFVDPTKFKFMWSIAQKTVGRKQKRIVYLNTKLQRLKKKVNYLNNLVNTLKKGNKRLFNCQDRLL